MTIVHPIFLLSGFAALVYQVVWQRALCEVYGVNSESVAMIVTVFMLGLGLGSLLGGAWSRDPRRPLLRRFAAIELAIATFGFFSLPLIRTVGDATAQWPTLAIGLVAFAIVLPPTVLMGATLPLLVADRVRVAPNVGRSVAGLYAANTLGAALASFAAAFLLLGALGQTGSTRLAAAVNAFVALVALRAHWRTLR